MLATKDKGILLQIVKRCNRIDDILSNVAKKVNYYEEKDIAYFH